ncbi:MAG: hypothetical protein A3C35_04195 [Omnitrophica bacterium RIFCSPHIGHO2_02_FULL_46_11]|nr:MAG: hypothetical protein A3A81_06060 [Omnitrophica bacterium RIFCSPLOWO2_01_FULL_45_10b]OGW86907.1 MAG: hypothetical protein A3C35_04195 [Omnitrophica bacterium RIFCSPHIGHO2_02_FULL_46_11]
MILLNWNELFYKIERFWSTIETFENRRLSGGLKESNFVLTLRIRLSKESQRFTGGIYEFRKFLLCHQQWGVL